MPFAPATDELLCRFLSKNYLTSFEGSYPTMKYLYVALLGN